MTVPGLFLIMKSDGWLIHMGWAVGVAGFARVNLSPDGDGCRQPYRPYILIKPILSAAGDRCFDNGIR